MSKQQDLHSTALTPIGASELQAIAGGHRVVNRNGRSLRHSDSFNRRGRLIRTTVFRCGGGRGDGGFGGGRGGFDN